MSQLQFAISAGDGVARTGVIRTPRGDIRTPAFMPDDALRAMPPQAVPETGADIAVANADHLMLRPGPERIARLGGLHRFSGWDRPILTGWSGLRATTPSQPRKRSEDGVKFRSPIDGAEQFLSPERAMDIQRLLGSDIHMVLDECPAFFASRADSEKSLALSLRWAARSRKAGGDEPAGACFGVVQGGVFADLRQRSAHALREIGFDGYAIGGLGAGEDQGAMFEVLDATAPHLPVDRPRYLVGAGAPDDIAGAVLRGVDLFDGDLPTRFGHDGQAFTRLGTVNMRDAGHADDSAPLDESCACPACRQFSRAYLHHLVKAKEILASMLLTGHNQQYFQTMMAALRAGIAQGRIGDVAAQIRTAYRQNGGKKGAEKLD